MQNDSMDITDLTLEEAEVVAAGSDFDVTAVEVIFVAGVIVAAVIAL